MESALENLKIIIESLEPKVKEKAIEVAKNIMMTTDKGKEEALREGIKLAKEWYIELEG